ncbi:MAG: hypothetical protein WBP79_07770, partial [Candidatus Acidiferrales bacterium]
MNLLRKFVSAFGGICLVVLLIAALAPKTTRGLVATLVQVTNTTSNPVPTFTVDHPGRQSVELFVGPNNNGVQVLTGEFAASGVFIDSNGPFTVPTGTRLVIDSVSTLTVLPSGQKLFLFRVITTNTNPGGGVAGGTINLLPQFTSTQGNDDIYESSQNLTAYADPGSQVSLFCDRAPFDSG